MQEAFQAYMLSGGGGGGGGNSGKKKKKRGGTPNNNRPTPKTKTNSGHAKENYREVQTKKIRKQYWQILNHFRKTVQEDWLQTDDHLGRVVASLVNLRDRIHMTSKQLWQWKHNPPSTYHNSNSSGRGYRKRRDETAVMGYLTQEDLELALSHGLIQHEKMLQGARKLVSALNQAQEALGRRLDELYLFHLEIGPILPQLSAPQDNDGEDLVLFAEHMVHWSRTVFIELANELYRKQCLVETLVDSVDNGLLYKESDDDLTQEDDTPRTAASKCLEAWPRGGSEEQGQYLADLLAATPWEE